jgi:diacylglycerol kinase (ATP)
MTAVALLHPDVSPKAVKPFQKISPELQIKPDLRCAENLQAAVIFGGDGTVHRYLPELHKCKLPVLVVPAGSGNDFAKALGIRNAHVALRAWRDFCAGKKNVKHIDLGLIRSHNEETLFCCVAGAGLDAATNARANRMPVWLRSRGGYLLAALWSLAVGRTAAISVRSQETVPPDTNLSSSAQPAWLVAVGNAHRYGSGLKIVPEARLDDGLLDVCLVAEMSKFKLLCALPTVFWGGHVGLKQVQYFRTARVLLEANPGLEIYADGEPVCRTPAEFSIIGGALNVIVPA